MDSLSTIILSGGFSSRMGTDKGLVTFQGSSLIESSLKLASMVTENIMIIANTPGYTEFGYPVYPDIIKERGPIGGIHAGLSHSETTYNLVLACDMPLMRVEILLKLIDGIDKEYEVVVPRHRKRLEPLCAVYSTASIQELELAANSPDRSLHSFIETTRANILGIDESLPYYSPYLFSNVNDREELLKLEEISQ